MKFEKNNMKEKVLKNLMELTVMRKTKELKRENFKTQKVKFVAIQMREKQK